MCLFSPRKTHISCSHFVQKDPVIKQHHMLHSYYSMIPSELKMMSLLLRRLFLSISYNDSPCRALNTHCRIQWTPWVNGSKNYCMLAVDCTDVVDHTLMKTSSCH